MLYLAHYGLHEPPFSIAPNPRFLHPSARHREAMAHLHYGMQSDGGIVLLTGEVGTGKTTLCRALLDRLPAGINLAFIFNPRLTVDELLATLCEELAIASPPESSVKQQVDRLNAFLLAAHAEGRHTVAIIDEAQNLSVEVLEQLRLLTNLETAERKLLQIVLIGQPELHELLARRELRQFSQRIVARFHLTPLDASEVGEYIDHRLQVAGAIDTLFSPAAKKRVAALSRGIPRLINLICDRALLGGYAAGRRQIDAAMVETAAAEALGSKRSQLSAPIGWSIAAALTLSALFLFRQLPPSPISPPAAVETIPVPAAALAMPATGISIDPERLAMVELLRQSGLTFGAGEGEPCAYAARASLYCLTQPDDGNRLPRVGGAALLVLHNQRGEELFAVRPQPEAEQWLVVANGGIEPRPAKLLRNWHIARYRVLWQQPPAYTDSIRPGAEGEAVDWLGDRLNEAGISGTSNRTFTPRMQERLRQFQQQVGLPADGVAGRTTLEKLVSGIGERRS